MSTQDDMSTAQLLQAALALAARGLRVFPVLPGGKQPYKGFQWTVQATTDETQVREWWSTRSNYLNANLAVATGELSGVTVLDFDVKKGEPGMQTLVQLFSQGVPYSRTPSGGVHVWMRYHEQLGNRKLRHLGLDIQGNDAYVVVPPSIVEGKPYVWVDCAGPVLVEPDQHPEWYQELLRGVPERPQRDLGAMPVWWRCEIPQTVRSLPRVGPALLRKDYTGWDGDRSRALMGIAVALFEQELQPETVFSVLMTHVPEAAEDRRGSERADSWMWQYVVGPAYRRVCAGKEARDRALGLPDDPGALPPSQDTAVHESRQTAPLPGSVLDRIPARSAEVYEYLQATLLSVNTMHKALQFMELMVSHRLVYLEEDELLKNMAKQLGVGYRTVTREYKRIKDHREREEAEQRRQQLVESYQEHEYVYVVSADALWSFRSQQFESTTAFRRSFGKEAFTEAFEKAGYGERVKAAVYSPQNQWAPEFDPTPSAWRYATNPLTGEVNLNMWRPSPLVPNLGATERDIQPYLDRANAMRIPFVEQEMMWDWMAYTLQHPGRKLNQMLLLGGDQGTGKNFLLHPLVLGLGERNCCQVTSEEMDGGFSPEVHDRKLLMIDEMSCSDWKEPRKVYNRLKPLIAAPPHMLTLNPKYARKLTIPNIISVAGTTNDREPVQLERSDRRLLMIWADLTSSEDRRYTTSKWWAWAWHWMNAQGGAEAVVGWLLRRDLSHFRPGEAARMTEWKDELLNEHVSPLARTLDQLTHGSNPELRRELVTSEALENALQMDAAWIRARGRVSAVTIGRAARELGWKMMRLRVHSERFRVYAVRNVEEWGNRPPASWARYLSQPEYLR